MTGKVLTVAFGLALACTLAFGQASAPAAGDSGGGVSVSLQNQEDAWFYFSIDPPQLAGLTRWSPALASKLTQFFAQETEDFPFAVVKPRAELTLEGLPEGSHLLVGFFVSEEATDCPVRVFVLQADRKLTERVYEVYREPALITVERGTGRLARIGAEGTLTEVAETPRGSSGVKVAVPEVAQANPPGATAPSETPKERASAAGEAAPATEAASNEAAPAAEAAGESGPAAAEAPRPAEQAGAESPVENPPAGASASEAATAEAPAEAAPGSEAAEAPSVAPAQQAGVETRPIASFPTTFSPVFFTRETEGNFTVLPISESYFWNSEGTRLSSVAGARSGDIIALDLTTADRFSAQVSYFLYLFKDRTLGKDNSFTLEIKPTLEDEAKEGAAGDTSRVGMALLWEKGSEMPVEVGTLRVIGETSELDLSLSALPPEAREALGENPTMDLTSCRFDKRSGTYEEYFYTTFALEDLPAATR